MNVPKVNNKDTENTSICISLVLLLFTLSAISSDQSAFTFITLHNYSPPGKLLPPEAGAQIFFKIDAIKNFENSP